MLTAEMFLRDNQHDTDFSAFISIWFFEEQKHSLALLEYLRRFAPDYLPTEEELAAVRFNFDPAPALDSLALHVCGEIRLNNGYHCARQYHTEPVIRSIYRLLANDEARHARADYSYMQRALERDSHQARSSFSKIGVLMTDPRMNRAMPHPSARQQVPVPERHGQRPAARPELADAVAGRGNPLRGRLGGSR